MVVPRPSSHAYVQDVMSINDLLAFATGARFAIESITMVTIDDELAARTGLHARRGMAGGARLPSGRGRRRPDLSHGVLHQPGVRGGRPDAAEPHRTDLPAASRTCSASASSKCARRSRPSKSRAELAAALKVEPGTPALRDAAHLHHLRREIAQVTVNTHPGARFRHSMTHATSEGLPGVRTAQRDSELAAESYASGLWVRETLADALRRGRAGTPTAGGPDRRSDTPGLRNAVRPGGTHWPARCWPACPVGSVVSFMLPNWHEAAIVYHARDAGRHGGQPDPAVAARPRAGLHPGRCRRPNDLRARRVRRPRLCGDAAARDRRDAAPPDRRRGARRATPGAARRSARSSRPGARHHRCWIPTRCG